MLHIIIKIYVFLRRKTENIFVFIAPFLVQMLLFFSGLEVTFWINLSF